MILIDPAAPAAPVDLADIARLATQAQTAHKAHPTKQWACTIDCPPCMAVDDLEEMVTPAVLATLVQCARALREVDRIHRRPGHVADFRCDECLALTTALAGIIDTAGPGGSG